MSREKKLGRVVYLMTMMALILMVLGYIAYFKIDQSEKARLTDELLERIHITSLEIFKNDSDFFTREVRNRAFFDTGESPFISRHQELTAQLQLLIAEAAQRDNMNMDADLSDIAGRANQYDSTFRLLVEKLYQRGLETTGAMGRFEAAAQTATQAAGPARADLLDLRLREKSYLMIRDRAHFEDWKRQFEVLRTTATRNTALANALQLYSEAFEFYVSASEELGLAHYTGLRKKLNDEGDALLNALNGLSNRAETITLKSYSQGSHIFLISIVVCIGFLFALMILIVKNII